jgi:hypothetical protein
MLTLTRSAAATFAVASALGLSACGGEDRKTAEAKAEEATTPAQAIEHIHATATALDEALAAFEAGEKDKAHELVSEGYLEHFEHVEGPLGKVDHDLNEHLEEVLSMELRDKLEAGAPEAEVEKTVEDAKASLATAEQKLR